MSAVRVLIVTITPDKADAFARSLCEERVVACVNVVPSVRSHYWWQGELCHEEEALLVMETAADRLDEAMARIVELHPYETPKVLAVSPDAVPEQYETWCLAQTHP